MPIADRPALCGRVLWEGWELELLCAYLRAGNIYFSLSAPGGRPYLLWGVVAMQALVMQLAAINEGRRPMVDA